MVNFQQNAKHARDQSKTFISSLVVGTQQSMPQNPNGMLDKTADYRGSSAKSVSPFLSSKGKIDWSCNAPSIPDLPVVHNIFQHDLQLSETSSLHFKLRKVQHWCINHRNLKHTNWCHHKILTLGAHKIVWTNPSHGVNPQHRILHTKL